MVVVLFALALAAPFRLADLLREARDRNPELKAAAARAHAATESISPAGALEDPMLMVQVWNAPVDLSSIPVMIQLTQPIPLGGKRGARTDAARADVAIAEADLVGKRRDIETQVVYKKAGHEVVSFVIWSGSSTMSGGLIGSSFRFVLSSAGSSATLAVSSAVVSEFLSEVGLYSNLVSHENSNCDNTHLQAR